MAQNHRQQIRHWLSHLGMLCTTPSGIGEKDATAKIGLYAESLKDLPPAVFTMESCEEAASRFRFFPSYAEVREFLGEWRRQHNPMPLLAGPHLRKPPEQDPAYTRAALARDWDDPTGIASKVAQLDGHPMQRYLMARLRMLVMQHAPQHLHLVPGDDARHQADRFATNRA